MDIEPCSKVCSECGFLPGSPVGILQPEIREYIAKGILFPCHMKLRSVTGSDNQGVELYMTVQPTVKVCRGYIIAMIKSGIPPQNQAWAKLYHAVGSDIDPRVMDIQETLKYHKR